MENQFPEKSLLIIIGELYVKSRIMQDHIEILEQEGADENTGTDFSDDEGAASQGSTADAE
jgi:hypothetical protein